MQKHSQNLNAASLYRVSLKWYTIFWGMGLVKLKNRKQFLCTWIQKYITKVIEEFKKKFLNNKSKKEKLHVHFPLYKFLSCQWIHKLINNKIHNMLH